MSIDSYANSVLQALYFCAPFRDLLLQNADGSDQQPAVPHPPPSASSPAAKRRPERSSEALVPNGTPTPNVVLTPSPPPTLSAALRSLFLFIAKNPAEKGTVAPRAFIDKLKEVNELFRSTMHQDAHEFLNYLLNKIVEETEEERKQKGQTSSGEDCELHGSILLTTDDDANDP
jgi:ubiquitin carboxyl-terminal hydrolase 9/13